jgi:hypothetical protein
MNHIYNIISAKFGSNGSALCGYYSTEAALFPHDAEYYSTKFGSNGPARRGDYSTKFGSNGSARCGMGPRDAVWVRAMRYGSARCGMGPRDAEII